MNKLTLKELELISLVIDDLEQPLKQVYRNISGGFVVADMFDYDNEYIDVELRFGTQNDCEDNVFVEQYKIDRQTMTIID